MRADLDAKAISCEGSQNDRAATTGTDAPRGMCLQNQGLGAGGRGVQYVTRVALQGLAVCGWVAAHLHFMWKEPAGVAGRN